VTRITDAEEEQEISKSVFKEIYFKHASTESGWTQPYWDNFFEDEVDKKYFVIQPRSHQENRMFIRSGAGEHCIYFLTEEAEESFFRFPTRDEG
jgi:hypothetical protein